MNQLNQPYYSVLNALEGYKHDIKVTKKGKGQHLRITGMQKSCVRDC